MSLLTIAKPTLPNQKQGSGDDLALTIELFTGEVEGTIQREAKIVPYINMRPVVGTSTLTNEGIGESTLQVLKKGEAPDPTINQANQVSVTVETTVIARNWIAQIDDIQKNYNFRAEIASEHGKTISKFTDHALSIIGAKAGMRTASEYGLPGHSAATQVLIDPADRVDPAALIVAFQELFKGFNLKDVNPQSDGVIVVVPPDVYWALSSAEQIMNKDYITAQGNNIYGADFLKAFGVPIISSNNLPNSAITDHFLSTVRNGKIFDGDFTKLVAVAFSPKAILAGQTVSLSTDMWWDSLTKGYYIDAWLAFSATPNRVEYAGVIQMR